MVVGNKVKEEHFQRKVFYYTFIIYLYWSLD